MTAIRIHRASSHLIDRRDGEFGGPGIPARSLLLSGAIAGHRLAPATVLADGPMGVMRINYAG